MSTNDALVADLISRFGPERVSDSPADKSAYAQDLWPRQLISLRARNPRPEGPRAVVWPENPEEIAELMDLARAQGFALQPYGAGSGVVGAMQPDQGTVMVDTKRMRRLHRVDLDEGVCEADVGILGEHLEEKLSLRGATLGHFPSSIYCSTLGGWIATRSAGQCSGRYGKIEDMVLSLDGVMATGEIFTAGAPPEGDLDMRPLWVGSEGTFGLITRAVLRVWPAPIARRGLSFTFEHMEDAWEALRALYQAGLRPAVSRLYDPFDTYVFMQGASKSGAQKPKTSEDDGGHAGRRAMVEALTRRALSLPGPINLLTDALGRLLRGRSLLIVIFEETTFDPADDPLARARELCSQGGGRDAGKGPVARWLARRHAVSYRMAPTYARGIWVDTMEVAAPWSRLGELYSQVRKALSSGGFVMAHMSHAYPDGCSIYFTFAGASPDDSEALKVYDATWERALRAAHSAGGTVAHHHGIGRSKRGAMAMEWGAGVRVLEALRAAADPSGVMVRGPLIPEGEVFPSESALGAPSSRVVVDSRSRLVSAEADVTGTELSEALGREGLSITGLSGDITVARWLGEGARGYVNHDPVDHLVAGWRAKLSTGERAWWQAAPRRSAGPDVLWLMARDARFGTLSSVTLRARSGEERDSWVSPYREKCSRDPALEAWVARAALKMPGTKG